MFEHHHLLGFGERRVTQICLKCEAFGSHPLESTRNPKSQHAGEVPRPSGVRVEDPERPRFAGWTHGRPAGGLPGSARGWRAGGSAGRRTRSPSCPGRSPASPRDAAARSRAPAQAAVPAGLPGLPHRPRRPRRPHRPPRCARGPPRAFRSPRSRQARSSDPLRALRRCPAASTRNVPSICPLPRILLPGPGPARLRSSAPDPLPGSSSRPSGLACHGPGATTFIACLHAFPPTERGDPLARPSPNSDGLDPRAKY